jgi:hypothetical protein
LTTIRQRRANGASAKASTGPKTKAGRAWSARNALRHGLTISFWSELALKPQVEEIARPLPIACSLSHIHKRVPPSIGRFDFVRAADVTVLQVNPDGWDALVTSKGWTIGSGQNSARIPRRAPHHATRGPQAERGQG